MFGGFLMFFHVGRQSRFGWPGSSKAEPNWLVTDTSGAGCLPATMRKHSRCAAGLVIGKTLLLVGVVMILTTGLQWNATTPTLGRNPPGLNLLNSSMPRGIAYLPLPT